MYLLNSTKYICLFYQRVGGLGFQSQVQLNICIKEWMLFDCYIVAFGTHNPGYPSLGPNKYHVNFWVPFI